MRTATEHGLNVCPICAAYGETTVTAEYDPSHLLAHTVDDGCTERLAGILCPECARTLRYRCPDCGTRTGWEGKCNACRP